MDNWLTLDTLDKIVKNDYMVLLYAIIGSVLGGLFIHFIFYRFLKHTKQQNFIPGFLNSLKKPLYFLLPMTATAITVTTTEINNNEVIAFILNSYFIILFTWFLLRLIIYTRNYLSEKYQAIGGFRERKLVTQLYFIQKIAIAIVMVIACSLILINFDSVRELGKWILTSAGVTGVIIGFAAQKALANMIAGIQVAFTQPIRINDVVVVEKEFGTVEEITMSYVSIKLWDLRRLVLPLNYFIEKPFENWTKSSVDLFGTVFLYVDYPTDVAMLRKQLLKIAQESPLWNKKVCKLEVTDCTEQTMQLRILISANNAGDLWDLRCDLREKMLDYLRRNYPASLPKLNAHMLTEENA